MFQLGLWTGISFWLLIKDSSQGFIVPSKLIFFSLLTRCTNSFGRCTVHTVLSFQELWIKSHNDEIAHYILLDKEMKLYQALEIS